jgi:hypothetical protein
MCRGISLACLRLQKLLFNHAVEGACGSASGVVIAFASHGIYRPAALQVLG